MWDLLTTVGNNLGMSIPNVILLLVVVGNLIFYAMDFKLGNIILFLMSGGLFMLYYNLGWSYVFAVIVFFMSLVVMALSLIPISNKSAQGGFI